MSIEQKINYQLNKYPAVKKVIKRAYQRTMYAISPKIKSEGNITRISPDDNNHEYFFGYYDKSPWDITDRYMLCLRANNTWSDVSPKETADIILIDTEKNEDDKNRVKKIAETRAWNVQQSCMLQWLGPDFSSRVLYNDFRDGKYVSVILTLATMEEKVIFAPVYSVSADGKLALSLDFSRLYSLRPGYGYYNVPEKTKGVALPDTTAISKVDLENGEVTEVLKYTDFANFQPRPEMKEEGAVHKVNHIMLSPNGKRFMVLYRWFCGQRKYTRLVTCNVDGTDMYVLSDDDMVSHCFWKDDDHVIAFENKNDGGPGYYLMKDKTQEYIHCWPQFSNDGHPSYSPDGSLIVTDSYPDRARVASINLMDGDETKKENTTIARVFAPFKYDNDTRCDLHPRWNHAGDKICFDSVFEGHRGLYVVDISDFSKDKYKKNKVVYVFTSCKRSGPVQIMYNLIKEMDREIFEPILVTLYDEVKNESDLDKFISLGVQHYKIPLGKIDILLNKTVALKRLLNDINPSIIHSMGVFPDYAVSNMGFNCQVITLHNYMHEDFIAKFGVIKGTVLEKLQMSGVKKAAKVWTCSESLSRMYKKRNNLYFDYIRNGVDVSRYKRVESEHEKYTTRNKLKIPQNRTTFIYTGQFIDRKDQEFLLDLFESNNELHKYLLILLGDGINLERLRNKYNENMNVIFAGNVNNVEEYLKASDYYISCSRSEGLPTSVLEAMSCGLPVILSDIMQHKEILEINNDIGVLFRLGDKNDCTQKIFNMLSSDWEKASSAAYKCAHGELSASRMSKKYQEEYLKVIRRNN